MAADISTPAADEQGLGKTVQMLALIVSKGPAPEDARKALNIAKRQQDAMQLHPLGSAARLARAAQLGVSPSPLQNRSSSLGMHSCLSHMCLCFAPVAYSADTCCRHHSTSDSPRSETPVTNSNSLCPT